MDWDVNKIILGNISASNANYEMIFLVRIREPKRLKLSMCTFGHTRFLYPTVTNPEWKALRKIHDLEVKGEEINDPHNSTNEDTNHIQIDTINPTNVQFSNDSEERKNLRTEDHDKVTLLKQ